MKPCPRDAGAPCAGTASGRVRPRLATLCAVMVLAVLALTAAQLQGCAYSAYGLYDDQRLMDTITDDKALATSIKTALMQAHFTDGWAVAVYCYYGNVFLVGEVPKSMQAKAVSIARSYKPRSVTPHWFTPATSDTSNFVLATTLRKDLIGTKGLSSTRIDTEVNAGRVVLLGVVGNDAEKQLAIRTARQLKGVVSVTSYLMLPQKPSAQAAGQSGSGNAGAARAGGQAPASGPQEHELPAVSASSAATAPAHGDER